MYYYKFCQFAILGSPYRTEIFRLVRTLLFAHRIHSLTNLVTKRESLAAFSDKREKLANNGDYIYMSRLIIAITPSVALVSPHSKEILINIAPYKLQSSCEMYPAQDLTIEVRPSEAEGVHYLKRYSTLISKAMSSKSLI